jgi:hypothetical protein
MQRKSRAAEKQRESRRAWSNSGRTWQRSNSVQSVVRRDFTPSQFVHGHRTKGSGEKTAARWSSRVIQGSSSGHAVVDCGRLDRMTADGPQRRYSTLVPPNGSAANLDRPEQHDYRPMAQLLREGKST